MNIMTNIAQYSAPQVALDNQLIAFLSPRQYRIGGMACSFTIAKKSSELIYFALFQFAGQEIAVGLNTALANTILNLHGKTVENITPAELNLLTATAYAQALPAQVQLKSITTVEPLLLECCSLVAKENNLGLTIYCHPTFPVLSFLQQFDGWLCEMQPSAFYFSPVTLPLVAATFTVNAQTLENLEVGDIVMVGA